MLYERGVTPASLNHTDVSSVLQDAFVDVSQNPARKPWTNRHGMNRALCSTTTLYSFGQDRLLFPQEYWLLQGWPKDVSFGEMSGSKLKDMASAGMALPSLASLVWSLYLLKEFPS